MVSVVIPTFNRRDLIGYTLESLRAEHQPGVRLEVIVIDDGSTDGTQEFIHNNFPWVKLLQNPGKGAPAARNHGLANANGDFIHFLDSDDLAGSDFFSGKVNFLNNNPVIDACYGKYDFFASDGSFEEQQVIFKHKYVVGNMQNVAIAHMVNYLRGSFLPANAIVWRKAFLVKIGGFDESLPVNQDVDLFINALLQGLQIEEVSADATRVLVRSHTLDVRIGTANSEKKLNGILDLRKKIYDKLKKSNVFDKPECYAAMSAYLFNFWKSLRHDNAVVAERYLSFAKEVYWPVPSGGNIAYRTLVKMVGPVAAANIKYKLLKRD